MKRLLSKLHAPSRYRNLPHALLDVAVRALALFAGLGLILGLASSRYDANWIWVRGGIGPALLDTALGCFAFFVLFGRRVLPRIGSQLAAGFGLVVALACLGDTIGYYRLVGSGQIATSLPVPLSLPLALLLAAWSVFEIGTSRLGARNAGRTLWQKLAEGTTTLAALAAIGLAHIVTFGATDYRRPADAAVVFGAAVRADGSPSSALSDRTRTACDLYHAGLVDRIVLSGGRGPDAPISEPECMARIARDLGVPSEALVLDEQGSTTRRSIEAVARLAAERGWARLLLVSHDYHLARIHMDARRRGLVAYTVPAEETAPWRAKPLFVLREVAAFAWYYARPVT